MEIDRNETRTEQIDRILAEYSPNGSADESLIDLLTDAMHWCHLHDEDFDALLNMARLHVEVECEQSARKSRDAADRDVLSPQSWHARKIARETDGAERHNIVRADGEEEVTSAVHRTEDAAPIVRRGNLHSMLISCLSECARILADFDDSDGEEGDAYRAAVRVLDLARRA